MAKHSFTISAEQQLDNAGIRITAVRLLIWKTIINDMKNAFTIGDIEALLPTVDRSTMFRTIHTFVERNILHEIDDGSSMQKYCICSCDDNEHHLGHVHLTCTQCHKTFCLTNIVIPAVPLPSGFILEQSEYIVKGICNECSQTDKTE